MNKKIRWIFCLSSIVYFLQGIGGLPAQALFVYMKKVLNLSPSTIMYLGSIIGLAWLIKPVIGYIIDGSGWKKKNWILLALLIDIIVSLFLGITKLPLFILITCLFFCNWNTAFRDVSVDGIMCVEGKKYGLTGKIQAVQWISIVVAGILIGLIGGYIAEVNNYKLGFLLLIPFLLIALFLTNKYKEEKTKSNLNIKETLSQYKLLWRDKRFVYASLFLFLYCYAPSFGTALDFIKRDVFHWSELWIGRLGAIIAVCEIVGAVIYFKINKRINIKKWLIFSVFLGAINALCYLYYTPASAIIYGITFATIGMFIHLIVMDFMARISINGLESTSFALLCSVYNLASTASLLSGGYLLPKVGLKPLIIISSLTSFMCLLFINKLRINEE